MRLGGMSGWVCWWCAEEGVAGVSGSGPSKEGEGIMVAERRDALWLVKGSAASVTSTGA